MTSGGYKVGYGKPPLETRFAKGKSGNPAGRKSGSKNISTLLKDALEEQVTVTIDGSRRRMSKLQAAFIQQANKAAGGDIKAIKLLLDMLAGSEAREAVSTKDVVSPEARRERDSMVLQALRGRIEEHGEEE